MAYAMTKQGSLDNCVTYEFICDTITDMNAIENKYRTIGTIAIVLTGESGGLEVYISGSNKQWISLSSIGASSGSESTNSELSIYICSQNEVSNGLPNIQSPDENTIYLVSSGNTSGNLYEEYIYVNNTWEKFGSVNIDLSNYIQSTDAATYDTLGVVKAWTGGGIGLSASPENGRLYIYCSQLDTIKAGTHSYQPIVPGHQHQSVFYGLAKAAGDVTQSASDNAVGTYTEGAKTAIQKMLGVYESPWELINSETFTNATEADKIITVDSNNEAFELEEVMLMVELPQATENDIACSKGTYGQVWFFYDENNHITTESGNMSRNAGDAAKGAWHMINYQNNLVVAKCTGVISNTNSGALMARFVTFGHPNSAKEMGVMIANNFSINRINIKSVTGNCHYTLYGRRKVTT